MRGARSTEDQLARGPHSSGVCRQLRSVMAERAAPFLVFRGWLDRDLGVDRHRDRAAGQPDRCDLGRHDECRVRQPSRTDLRADRYSQRLGPLAKAAWTGAIVSNILVVNGAAMVVAGLRFGRIRFSMERAQDVGASLMIASVAVFLPSIYAESRRHLPTPQMSIDYVGEISIGLCVLLLILYGAAMARIAQRARARTLQATAAAPNPSEPSGAAMSTGLAIALLAISSLLVALLSEFVADSVDVVNRAPAGPIYRTAPIEIAVVMNAVLGAYTVQQALTSHGEKRFGVLYGVYLLETRQIWAPQLGGSDWFHVAAPPRS